MSWIINGVYISDDDCIYKPTMGDNIKLIHPTINDIKWE